MRVLLALNGPLPPAPVLRAEAADWLLAADGGANQLLKIGLSPKFVVGDLDSIDSALTKQLAPTALIHHPDQSKTDGEKAIEYALEQGATTLVVCGAAGGRLDHQLSNLSTLCRFADQVAIELLDPSGRGYFVHHHLQVPTQIGQQISLIPFGTVAGIRTHGLRYPLSNEPLTWAGRSGQSNEATAPTIDIRLTKGLLFVFITNPSD